MKIKLTISAFLFLIITILFPWSVKAQCPEGMITSVNNLIRNGDFENTEQTFKTDYVRSETAGAGKYNIVKDAKEFSAQWFTGKGDGYFMATDGAQGPNKVVWQQDIGVKKNTIYFFSAWASNLLNIKDGPPAVLQFSINDVLIDKPFKCSEKLDSWEQFFVTWNSKDNDKISIKIVSQNPDWNGNDFGLDRLKFYECNSVRIESELSNKKVNEVVTLRNVLFKSGSAEILNESLPDLNYLFDYLNSSKTVEIEISGHTDDIGSDKDNLKLSQDRANMIRQYLIEKGISGTRIVAVGYGESKPISPNETLEGKQKNRRTEVVIKKL